MVPALELRGVTPHKQGEFCPHTPNSGFNPPQGGSAKAGQGVDAGCWSVGQAGSTSAMGSQESEEVQLVLSTYYMLLVGFLKDRWYLDDVYGR